MHVLDSLHESNFRWYWLSGLCQAASQGMQFLILAWVVLEMTDDSSAKLGMMFFFYGVAHMFAMMIGGLAADKMKRSTLMIYSQVGVIAINVVLAGLIFLGNEKLWQVYVVAVALGLVQAIYIPSRIAIISDLVSRKNVMNAMALNVVVVNGGRIIGPVVAGIVIDQYGTSQALLLVVAMCILVTAFLLLVKYKQEISRTPSAGIFQELVLGLRYAWSKPAVRFVAFGNAVISFFVFPYMQLMPAFSKQVHGGSADDAGFLLMAASIGATLGNLILASLGNFRNKAKIFLSITISFCLILILFSWTPWYWPSWVLLLLVGMTSMTYLSIGMALLQLLVPVENRGRVTSVFTFGAPTMFMGTFPLGLMAGIYGWPVAFTTGAILGLIFVMWQGVWVPTMRRLSM